MVVVAVERIVLVLQVEEVKTGCDGFQCTLRTKSVEALQLAMQELPKDPKMWETNTSQTSNAKKSKDSKGSSEVKIPKAVEQKLKKSLVQQTIGKAKKATEDIPVPELKQ